MVAKKSKPNELYIERIYDAPVKVVWDAWTDPKQVAKWWGPRGFSITTHSKDLRVGGHWSYTMHGPDGTKWENKTIYFEVENCAKLVYDHGGNDDRPPLFRVTVLFSEVKGNKTRMEMTMALPTAEAAAETKKFVKQAGGNSTWDRLGEYLEKEQNHKEKFVINRSFEAPLDLVFKMWTDPKHFSQWLPPAGMTMQFLEAEIKPGGSCFFSMTGADFTMYGRTKYLEIEKPNKVVYLQQFADEKGNVSRHPMAPTWPETMLTTVTFALEDGDNTRVTIVWEPYGEVSQAELKAFIEERAGMTQGWTGSFDKLEEELKKNR